MEQSFKQRKFSLTDATDKILIENAQEHYAGNKSLFLRNAISDHARTLAGEDEFVLRSLIPKVETLMSMVRELNDQIDEGVTQTPIVTHAQNTPAKSLENGKQSLDQTKREIHRLLLESEEEQLTLVQISDNVDAESIVVQEAVIDLTEQGYLKTVDHSEDTHFAVDI